MKLFRAENVGSLLRPDYLLKAREQHASGGLNPAAFKKIEDQAVDECVALQEESEIDIFSDGEMRRAVFADQLAQATEGFGVVQNNAVDWFRMDGTRETSPVTKAVTSKLKRTRHLSSEEFSYLRAKTAKPIKMTLPSPTMYAYYWLPGVSDQVYASNDAYLADVTDILKDEVDELIRLGCTYIQFDAPELGMLLDPHQQEWFRGKGFDVEKLVQDGTEMVNAAIAGHSGVAFALHICRGNDANRFMARGGYDSIARMAFGRSKVDLFLLEYDDERSGDFRPLSEVPDDRAVVLGLVSTKKPQMESVEELEARIREAAKYIALDRLCLSGQCGFASVAKGNNLSLEQQSRKLKLVVETARRVWS